MPSERAWEQRYDLESWSEFRELIGRVLAENLWGVEPESYWYRGHALASWPLRSSFDRMFAEVDPPMRRNVHQGMIEGLRERLDASEDEELLVVRDRLPANQRSDTHELAALAQHYGAPTRMLDWTESPYVAAFFAFADFPVTTSAQADGDEECCILALNTLAAAWNSDAGVELVQTDRRMNARLRRQRGVFTLNNSPASTLEDYCEDFYANVRTMDVALRKLVVPKGSAPGALRDLEMMGITSESMFPGMEGAARYAFVRSVDRHIWREA